MARTKTEKKEILTKLDGIVDKSQSLVFVNFHGLKVGNVIEMRRKLRADGVSFFVAKKSLITKALQDAKKVTGSMPEFKGELGIAYGDDLIAPARGIYEFQKKFKDGLSILGGVFESKYMDKEGMTTIASIPPKETLYAMLVNVLSSPYRGVVVALDQISKKK